MDTANKAVALDARDVVEPGPDAMNAAVGGQADQSAGTPAVCPVQSELEPAEPLFVPHPKRLLWTYDVSEDGTRALRIDYGIKEITFDEERFFVFGERLVSELSFTGEQATAWGADYTWDEVRPLLEALVADGILRRGVRDDDPRGTGLVPSKLKPSTCPSPRSWSLAECESITRDLAGRAVEVGHLEAVVPVFRIPHPALDADDRQVGEANVFPPGLRMDRETEWRVCQYPGSRYRDETPMNVTALKAMIKHWKPMMAVIVAVRAELQARLGLARDRWTIGELHVFSSVVCALPSYLLLKGGGSSPQVPLHPVLSSMFRVTDGVRMTTHEMLFDVDMTRGTDEPMTAAELYTHAERNGSLMGSHTGVCAGPRHMIEDYLATVIDGVDPERFAAVAQPPEVQALLAELPDAIDYGLRGLQTWGLALTVWVVQSRTYEALLGIFETAHYNDACSRLRTRLRADWNALGAMQMSLDHDRNVHLVPYVDAYEVSWRALRAPVGRAVHAEEIAPGPASAMHHAAARQLRSILGERLAGSELVAGDPPAPDRSSRIAGGGAPDGSAGGAGVPPRGIDRIVDLLVDYLRQEQAILAATSANQEAISALLDRPRPQRPLGARDIRTVYLMNGGSYPYLFNSLDDELGLQVEASAQAIHIFDRRAS